MRCDCQFNLLYGFLFCSIPSCILHLSVFRCSTIRIGVCGKCTQQIETSTKTIFIEYRARSYNIHSDVLRSLTHITIKSDQCLCVCMFLLVFEMKVNQSVYTLIVWLAVFFSVYFVILHLFRSLSLVHLFVHSPQYTH